MLWGRKSIPPYQNFLEMALTAFASSKLDFSHATDYAYLNVLQACTRVLPRVFDATTKDVIAYLAERVLFYGKDSDHIAWSTWENGIEGCDFGTCWGRTAISDRTNFLFRLGVVSSSECSGGRTRKKTKYVRYAFHVERFFSLVEWVEQLSKREVDDMSLKLSKKFMTSTSERRENIIANFNEYCMESDETLVEKQEKVIDFNNLSKGAVGRQLDPLHRCRGTATKVKESKQQSKRKKNPPTIAAALSEPQSSRPTVKRIIRTRVAKPAPEAEPVPQSTTKDTVAKVISFAEAKTRSAYTHKVENRQRRIEKEKVFKWTALRAKELWDNVFKKHFKDAVGDCTLGYSRDYFNRLRAVMQSNFPQRADAEAMLEWAMANWSVGYKHGLLKSPTDFFFSAKNGYVPNVVVFVHNFKRHFLPAYLSYKVQYGEKPVQGMAEKIATLMGQVSALKGMNSTLKKQLENSVPKRPEEFGPEFTENGVKRNVVRTNNTMFPLYCEEDFTS